MESRSPSKKAELPPIPAKRYFTIGEVSELCGVKPHVLRYWEQEFTQLKPVKRRGNRRYYQHHEVLLIRRIRELLYEDGFTISGARNRLDNAMASDERVEAHARTGAPRGVAQPGSVPAWGAGGREFKSRRPDQFSSVAVSRAPPGASRAFLHPVRCQCNQAEERRSRRLPSAALRRMRLAAQHVADLAKARGQGLGAVARGVVVRLGHGAVH
jgi:DNA-binding transcriptional MerR regulator